MLKACLICVIVSQALSGISQSDSLSPLIQLSGVVIEAQSNSPVPYANIFIIGSNRGTSAADNGFFSIVVRPSDTLRISSIGYKTTFYIIPKHFTRQKESVTIALLTDTNVLQMVYIHPWPEPEKLRDEFLGMELAVVTPLNLPKILNQNLVPKPFNPPLIEYDTGCVKIYAIYFLSEKVIKPLKKRLPKKKMVGLLPKWNSK